MARCLRILQWTIMPMKFFHSLSFRVVGGSFILLLMLFGLYSYVAINFHTEQMMSNVLLAANRASDIIKNSTHYSMLLNRKEDVYQIITTIGKEPGVEGIRIYNKRGTIMFSTDKSEEQSNVDVDAEACVACHGQQQPLQSLSMDNRMRIYQSPKGYRVLGLINPIRNEPTCSEAECHAHPAGKTVLGVLDVRMSLQQIDDDISDAKMQMSLYAVIGVAVFALLSLLFIYTTVHRPVKKLIVGTEEISAGNLQYHIPSENKDELGVLARSFNMMTESLRTVMEENERWSRELEVRVKEKTAELKRVHDQMLQIEKMASLGKLSATVAHELNNPLEGILTYAKLMAKRLRKIEEQTDASRQMLEELDVVIRETGRCGNIVKNLLLFSRKQVGEMALVPVNQIIQKAAELMKHHFQISNVEFQATYSSDDPTLLCDENQLQQAFVALFVNGVEAMPEGGVLGVSVIRNNEHNSIHIKITDTGIGIAEEDVPHIFEPFFTTKKNGKGVGLGLSVVYGIIERHGGDIAVHTEQGKGTTFTLLLPQSHSKNITVDEKSPRPPLHNFSSSI
ncbi:MAG: HAMP domain-containing protein [Bacteroidetes bacterium]|nr:MAG: HAMP domain-containing protein [Bacteroidota bacterium]